VVSRSEVLTRVPVARGKKKIVPQSFVPANAALSWPLLGLGRGTRGLASYKLVGTSSPP
jgi:hypothetical protein